jgi:hypothetical protein
LNVDGQNSVESTVSSELAGVKFSVEEVEDIALVSKETEIAKSPALTRAASSRAEGKSEV